MEIIIGISIPFILAVIVLLSYMIYNKK